MKLVPWQVLHGFVPGIPDPDVLHRVDSFHALDCGGAAHFDGQDLAIDWGSDADKDIRVPSGGDFATPLMCKAPG